MKNSDDFRLYQRELELIYMQNPIECELYSIVACLIRERNQNKKISLRDVSTRRKSEFSGSEIYASKSGFPDFVILSEDFYLFDDKFRDTSKILGAVEIKRMTVKLNGKSKQLLDHIAKFKKVLYTNGFEWRLYNGNKSYAPEWLVSLGKIDKGKVEWFEGEVWDSLLNELDKISWETY
ncbi:hypothetical protein HYG86_06105 [Alkalicella caledoniensis]|uniref:Uncharacterized protein n=1 Tax=Alkalicella caledoniensis TaxID=2731377 RepID=A0A7G9W6R2_ALKCA|nr:hypothetical protein [Alkalicella caledoniensis]QNO14374.1 hypothetical protein HYG86_06105 [Alkalicella caledoniensis]